MIIGVDMGILYEYVTKDKDTESEALSINKESTSIQVDLESMSKSEILEFLGSNSIFFVTQYMVKKYGYCKD